MVLNQRLKMATLQTNPYLGISSIGGYPKSSNFMGFSIISHPFYPWGLPFFSESSRDQQSPFKQDLFRPLCHDTHPVGSSEVSNDEATGAWLRIRVINNLEPATSNWVINNDKCLMLLVKLSAAQIHVSSSEVDVWTKGLSTKPQVWEVWPQQVFQLRKKNPKCVFIVTCAEWFLRWTQPTFQGGQPGRPVRWWWSASSCEVSSCS